MKHAKGGGGSNDIGEREFSLLRTITTCTPPQPPVPSNIQWGPDPTELVRDESAPWFQFEIPRVLCKNISSNGNFFNIGFKKNYAEEGLDGTYTTLLRINRPNGTSAEFANSQFNGFALSNSTAEGLYIISTFRRYFGATNNEVRNSVTLDVRGNCPARNSCNYNDGDFLGYNFQNFFVRVVGGKYYGVTSNGTFVSKSFLQSKNLPNVFLDCLEQTDTRGSDCDFTISASANPNNVNCGGSSQLVVSCSGPNCSGVSYAWSNVNTGLPASTNVTLPNSNGTVNYIVTASKSGCNNNTTGVSVTVSGCGGVLPACQCGFTLITANQHVSE
ncbi:MAG: hypothetical protein U5N85_18945 [Arcicella sp.]|nr:hypothetical protein [Arcicella sp.]